MGNIFWVQQQPLGHPGHQVESTILTIHLCSPGDIEDALGGEEAGMPLVIGNIGVVRDPCGWLCQ